MSTKIGSNSTTMITFFDGETGQVVAREDPKTLPEPMRWVVTPNGRVPIVEVYAYARGDDREIHEYGAHKQLLRTTLLRRG